MIKRFFKAMPPTFKGENRWEYMLFSLKAPVTPAGCSE
jgi:hypothetical protein